MLSLGYRSRTWKMFEIFWVIKMIPFQGQKQNRQPPDINFLPILGFEPRISHILGVTSPTMTLSPCRRSMHRDVSIYPPLHIAEPGAWRWPLLAPVYLLGHILWQNIQLVYNLPTYAFISQDIPTYPYLSCGYPNISLLILGYPDLYWDNPMSEITFLSLVFLYFLG